MIQGVLKKIFGSRNERLLKQYGKLVREVNALETSLAQLAAVGRFFDTLAERGDRLDYRAPVAAIADAHSAFRLSRRESLRGGEALAA